MSDINSVVLSGRLTRDPELRHTASGTAVASLRMVSNESRRQPDGSYSDQPTFIDVTVWGARDGGAGFAGLVADKCRKGDKITVAGKLAWREWEAQDGTKRQTIEIVARDIDGEPMYRKAGEAPARTETGNGAAPPAAQQTSYAGAAAADDDIPF